MSSKKSKSEDFLSDFIVALSEKKSFADIINEATSLCSGSVTNDNMDKFFNLAMRRDEIYNIFNGPKILNRLKQIAIKQPNIMIKRNDDEVDFV